MLRRKLLVGTLLVLVLHGAASSALGHRGDSLQVELGGDRDRAYRFAAVYRRFDRLAVRITNLEAEAGQQLMLLIERRPAGQQQPQTVLTMQRRVDWQQAYDGLPIKTEFRLGRDGHTLPIGRYQLRLLLETEERHRLVATKPFFVIFNASHPDEEVYQPHARSWLESEMKIVQLEENELKKDRWQLDIHDPAVFLRAMALAEGAQSGRAAADRIVPVVRAHVHGYWPDLVDSDGNIPAATPSDVGWQHGEIVSAVDRLQARDKRGQCFDYVMLYVALLRSVGMPARAVTVTNPALMPHPDAPGREVMWNYHVWAEVSLEGEWWASDMTYLDKPLGDYLPGNRDPGLQPRNRLWFARTLGHQTRYWTVRRGELHEVTEQYR